MHEAEQVVPVLFSNLNRARDVLSNLERNAEFADRQIRVRGDDGPRAVVDTLAHEVSPDTASLAVQPLLDRLKRSSRPLSNGSYPRNLIVDLGSHVILKHGSPIVDDVGRSVLLDFGLKGLVGLEHIYDNVTDVVLAPLLGIVFDRRANRRRRDRKNLADHPVRTGPDGAESHEINILVRNAPEYLENNIRRELHVELSRGGPVVALDPVDVVPFSKQSCEPFLLDLVCLPAAAPVLALVATAFHLAGVLKDILPPVLRRQRQRVLVSLLADKQLAALNAYTTKNLNDSRQVLNVEHRASEFHVSEVSRSLNIVKTVRGADKSGLLNTHPGVEQSTNHWLVPNIGVAAGNLSHGSLPDFLR